VKRLRFPSIIAISLLLMVPMTAVALPPDHKHAEINPVVCDAPHEAVTQVVVNSRSNSASAFLPDGRVAVAKLFEGTAALTVDGEVVRPSQHRVPQAHGLSAVEAHLERLVVVHFVSLLFARLFAQGLVPSRHHLPRSARL
jgi:hypothetical protein